MEGFERIVYVVLGVYAILSFLVTSVIVMITLKFCGVI